MTNPYEELNIPTNATDKEIKDAYRKQAKKHHPDVGGDKEKFSKLSNSYATLSNPGKREYYDKHGKEEPSGDKIINQAFALISKMIEDLLEYHGEDIIYKNILDEMLTATNANLESLNNELGNQEKILATTEKLIKQFEKRLKHKKVKTKVNFFEIVLANRRNVTKEKLLNLADQKQVLEMAIVMVGDFEFEFDEEPIENDEMFRQQRKQSDVASAMNELFRQKRGGF